jgi:hypothetical protein
MPMLNKQNLTKPNHLTVTILTHHSGRIDYNPWTGAFATIPSCYAGTILCHIANSDPRDISFKDYEEAYDMGDYYNSKPSRTVYIPKYKPIRDVFKEDMPDILDGKYWVAEEWYTAVPCSGTYATHSRDLYYEWTLLDWNINNLKAYIDPRYNKSGYDVFKDINLRYSEDIINMKPSMKGYDILYHGNITAPTINQLWFKLYPGLNNDYGHGDYIYRNLNTIHLYHITFKEKEYLEDHPELGIIYYIIPTQKPVNNITYTPVKRSIA